MIYCVVGLTIAAPSGDSGVRHIGDFEMFEDAINAAKQVIDEFLTANYKNGMTDVDLFSEYQRFGEAPFIFSDDAKTINVDFNYVKYAMSGSIAICACRSNDLPKT